MFSMRRVTFTAVAAASLLIATPAMATAEPNGAVVPFHGIYRGGYQAQVSPPNLIITATSGDGYATHLGHFELTDRIVAGLARGPVPDCPVPGTTETYTSTLTGANGDSITLAGTGHGCQRTPTTVLVKDAVTVTGGTGRFEGATGSITVRSFVDQSSSTVVIVFYGSISAP
jgi:hypothetical protein